MKEVPQHLQGLLRFCLEAGNEYPAGGIEPMDQEVEFQLIYLVLFMRLMLKIFLSRE